MKLAVEVPEGGYIPNWYGIAYRDFDRDTKVAYPLFLHLLVRWVRDFKFWLMSVARPGYRERVEHAAWARGRRAGEALLDSMCKNAYAKGLVDGEVQYIQRALADLDARRRQRD